MKKLTLNLVFSVSLFVVVSILLKVANGGTQIVEYWFNLKVQGPTGTTRTLELVSYLVFLPILAFVFSRLIYKNIFKNPRVSFNGIYFVLGFLIITLLTSILIFFSNKSIFSIPLYDNNVLKLLLNYQNVFKKYDVKKLVIIGTVFHNLLIFLFGTVGINKELKNINRINKNNFVAAKPAPIAHLKE